MGNIDHVEVHIMTGDRSRAGTAERVVLGLGGQEFEIDSRANDFQRGSDVTYVLGKGATVSSARHNDPRKLSLTDVEAHPVYLRVGLGPQAADSDETTAPGKGGVGDVINRAAEAAGEAGAAVRKGIFGAADTLRTLVASGDWDVEEVTVTVHSDSGTPVVFNALAGEEHAWIGGPGQPKQLTLKRA